jgi:site-specific DNA-methyltransferase (adenine-specific)/site-specific DNA-methyltransferase (cytosine-N4-specific)
MSDINLHCGDAIKILKQYPDGYFNLIVTSPPYADARKKHYLSIKPNDYPKFFKTFHNELWRVLSQDGSFVLNIKDKVVDGIRHRYVWHTIELLSKLGWRCVDDYIWHKPNAMPGYWPNRLRDEWEYCFHMTKQKKFAMYQDSVKKPIGDWADVRLKNLNGKSKIRHNSENNSGFGRDLKSWVNKETVLPGNIVSVPLVGKNMGHPAVYPEGLPQFFINLFSKENDNILDPFAGSGTTGIVAQTLNRNCVLIEVKEEYVNVMEKRLGVKRTKLSNIPF